MRKIGILLFAIWAAQALPAENEFPELDFKKNWDRGCLDWPVKLKAGGREANPSLVVEKGLKEFRFQARLILERLRGESPAEFRSSVQTILRDPKLYKDWIMPGINAHPEGRSYFVEVQDMKSRRLSESSFDLTGPFTFKLLWFKRQGTTTIQFRHFEETPPACDFFAGQAGKKPLIVRFRMIPRPDLLDWMIGEVWVIENDSQVELRLRSVLKPYRPIFELMPLSLVETELYLRAQRILENLIVFRKSRALKK